MITRRSMLMLQLLAVFAGWLALFAPSHRAAAADAESYQLAPNDMVDIRVFQEDDLSSKLRISPNLPVPSGGRGA